MLSEEEKKKRKKATTWIDPSVREIKMDGRGGGGMKVADERCFQVTAKRSSHLQHCYRSNGRPNWSTEDFGCISGWKSWYSFRFDAVVMIVVRAIYAEKFTLST